MKIALATICVGALREICCATTRNFRHYCAMHGYDCIIQTTRTSNLEPSWDKITLCKSLLGKYDWVFWIDSDCIILNMSKKLEDLIDNNYNIIIAENIYGINAGVWLIQNTPWSLKAMDEVWNLASTFHYTGTWEQAPLNHVIKKDANKGKCKIIPQRLMNAQLYKYWRHALPSGEYRPGDFVLHFPGIPNTLRIPLMRDYMKDYYKSLSSNINRHACREHAKLILIAPKLGPMTRIVKLKSPQCVIRREVSAKRNINRVEVAWKQEAKMIGKLVNLYQHPG